MQGRNHIIFHFCHRKVPVDVEYPQRYVTNCLKIALRCTEKLFCWHQYFAKQLRNFKWHEAFISC